MIDRITLGSTQFNKKGPYYFESIDCCSLSTTTVTQKNAQADGQFLMARSVNARTIPCDLAFDCNKIDKGYQAVLDCVSELFNTKSNELTVYTTDNKAYFINFRLDEIPKVEEPKVSGIYKLSLNLVCDEPYFTTEQEIRTISNNGTLYLSPEYDDAVDLPFELNLGNIQSRNAQNAFVTSDASYPFVSLYERYYVNGNYYDTNVKRLYLRDWRGILSNDVINNSDYYDMYITRNSIDVLYYKQEKTSDTTVKGVYLDIYHLNSFIDYTKSDDFSDFKLVFGKQGHCNYFSFSRAGTAFVKVIVHPQYVAIL